MNLHQILCEAWIFLCKNYLNDSEWCSYGQLVIGSIITTMCLPMHHVLCSFLAKHQTTQVIQSPYSPDLAPCDFWLFPKLKSPLKGKIFQTIDEIQENTWGSWNCVRSPGAYFERDWDFIVLCTVIFVLVLSSINVSIFHSTWLATFWTDLTYRFEFHHCLGLRYIFCNHWCIDSN